MTPPAHQSATDVTLDDHDRRLGNLEETVSETRKAVFGVQGRLDLIGAQVEGIGESLKHRGKIIEKLAIAAIIGIGGIVGLELLKLIAKGVSP
jgi:hypothetical protein